MEQQTYQREEDVVSLGEILLRFKFFMGVLRRKIWIPAVLILVFAAVFVVRTYLKPVEFVAEKEFIVNEEEGGGVGSNILSVISGFVGGSSGKYNYEKILALAKSDKIIYPTLFDTLTVNGQADLAANHLIRIYDFHEKWEEAEMEGKPGFLFSRNAINDPSGLESTVMKELAYLIRGGEDRRGLMRSGYNEDTQFLSLSMVSENEDISYYLLDRIYQRLSDFYITRTVAPQQRTYTILKSKVDSIRTEIDVNTRALAAFNDRSRNQVRQISTVPGKQYQQELVVLSNMLAESVKHLETSEFLLRNATPFFQEINNTLPPLFTTGRNYVIEAIKGAMLGIFLGVAFVLGKAWIDLSLEQERQREAKREQQIIGL